MRRLAVQRDGGVVEGRGIVRCCKRCTFGNATFLPMHKRSATNDQEQRHASTRYVSGRKGCSDVSGMDVPRHEAILNPHA